MSNLIDKIEFAERESGRGIVNCVEANVMWSVIEAIDHGTETESEVREGTEAGVANEQQIKIEQCRTFHARARAFSPSKSSLLIT